MSEELQQKLEYFIKGEVNPHLQGKLLHSLVYFFKTLLFSKAMIINIVPKQENLILDENDRNIKNNCKNFDLMKQKYEAIRESGIKPALGQKIKSEAQYLSIPKTDENLDNVSITSTQHESSQCCSSDTASNSPENDKYKILLTPPKEDGPLTPVFKSQRSAADSIKKADCVDQEAFKQINCYDVLLGKRITDKHSRNFRKRSHELHRNHEKQLHRVKKTDYLDNKQRQQKPQSSKTVHSNEHKHKIDIYMPEVDDYGDVVVTPEKVNKRTSNVLRNGAKSNDYFHKRR